MTKPTYEELLEALFGVTQALRNTLLLAGNMTGAEKDQRWTITHNAEFMCDPMKRLSRTVTWLRRLWASLRDPERCHECGLTRQKADIVRCPCDWRPRYLNCRSPLAGIRIPLKPSRASSTR